MTKETEGAAKPWPDYSTLVSPVFPDWLKKSVLELIEAYPDRLKAVGLEFWFTSYYDDNNNVQEHAGAYQHWHDSATRPTEDELDYIPGMRRMDRRATELIPILGIESDDEGSISHEVAFVINQGGLTYTKDDYNEQSAGLSFVCTPSEAGWVCEAIVRTAMWEMEENGLSETALVSGDMDMMMADLNPDLAGLKAWPPLLRYDREDEDNIELVFDLNSFLEKASDK